LGSGCSYPIVFIIEDHEMYTAQLALLTTAWHEGLSEDISRDKQGATSSGCEVPQILIISSAHAL